MKNYRCSSFCSFYKGGKFIQKYIENMLEQSIFNDVEFIFLDCASPDNEATYIKPLLSKYDNIKYYRLEKDPGLYSCWNIAINKCSSSIITNWNIDDRKNKYGLEILINELEADESLDMVYGLTFISNIPNETYDENQKLELFKSHEHSFSDLIKHNSPHCMPMWRKNIHQKCGYFNENYNSISDAEMWLKLTLIDGKIKKINKPVGLYFWNPQGRSTDKELSDQNYNDLKKAKIEILANMNDIEKLLPPIKEYKNTYDEYKDIGFVEMKNTKNIFISIVNNISQIPINIKKINTLLSNHKDSKLVIYNCGSTDNSETILNNLAKINKNIIILSDNSKTNLLLFGYNYYYNLLINLVKEKFSDYDFLTFIDINFIDISINGIANSFGYLSKNESTLMISGFNIQKEIYEAVNQIFLINKNALSYRLNYWSSPSELKHDYTYDISFSYQMFTPVVGSPPIPVYSNFGGCAIYRNKFLDNIRGDNNINDNYFVSLNKKLLSEYKNHNVLINPSQLMLSYHE